MEQGSLKNGANYFCKIRHLQTDATNSQNAKNKNIFNKAPNSKKKRKLLKPYAQSLLKDWALLHF